METKFWIDFDWWQQSGKDIYIDIQQICEEMGVGELDQTLPREATFDWVDPETAVVARVDGFMYSFLQTCSRNPDFINDRIPLTEAVFRTLLASGNRPMTPVELAERTGRPAATILRTLSGPRVYKGLRPREES